MAKKCYQFSPFCYHNVWKQHHFLALLLYPLEAIDDFDFYVFKGIDEPDINVLEGVHYLNLDIFEGINNLYFAVERICFAVFGDGAVLFVNLYINRHRTYGEGDTNKNGK